jgi:DHA1 family tetracycline resistance protein-like MFS transporter
VAAALCLVNALAALVLLPESRPRDLHDKPGPTGAGSVHAWLQTMTRPPLTLLLTVYFLGISAFTAITALLALNFEQRFGIGAQDMGVLFTLAGGATVLVRGALLGVLVRRLGEPKTVRLGATALLLAAGLIPLMPTVWWAALMVPLYAFGAGTLFPSLATLVSLSSEAGLQGTVLGGSQLVGGFGRVTAPLWGGWLFQHLGVNSPYHLAAVLAGLSLLLSTRIPFPASAGAAAERAAARASPAGGGLAEPAPDRP